MTLISLSLKTINHRTNSPKPKKQELGAVVVANQFSPIDSRLSYIPSAEPAHSPLVDRPVEAEVQQSAKTIRAPVVREAKVLNGMQRVVTPRKDNSKRVEPEAKENMDRRLSAIERAADKIHEDYTRNKAVCLLFNKCLLGCY